jgi:hypothetical protein
VHNKKKQNQFSTISLRKTLPKTYNIRFQESTNKKCGNISLKVRMCGIYAHICRIALE